MDSALLFPSLGSLEFLRPHFPPTTCLWTWLAAIAAVLQKGEKIFSAANLRTDGTAKIFIHRTARVDPGARITGPVHIGADCKIGPGAFVRENVLCGTGCTIGHGCEVKNSLFLDGATVPHLNYVGDSILGRGSHIGAGAVLANLRLDGGCVRVHGPEGPVTTELRKCGAFLGDGAQVGCNAVLQPGTMLGQRAWVHATIAFSGYLAEDWEAVPAQQPVIRRQKNVKSSRISDFHSDRDGVS